MDIKKELTKGSSSLLVLSVLKETDLYGYAIIKEIERRSDSTFSFKEGTLYPILHSMEQTGFVQSYWVDSEQGRKRKYYHITKKGLKELNDAVKEWDKYSSAVENVVHGKAASLSV